MLCFNTKNETDNNFICFCWYFTHFLSQILLWNFSHFHKKIDILKLQYRKVYFFCWNCSFSMRILIYKICSSFYKFIWQCSNKPVVNRAFICSSPAAAEVLRTVFHEKWEMHCCKFIYPFFYSSSSWLKHYFMLAPTKDHY